MSKARRTPLLVQSGLAWAVTIGLDGFASAAWGQGGEAPPQDQTSADDTTPIIVLGVRGSAVTDVAPIAELDSNAIAATGASTMGELQQAIRGQTQSADGSEPIFLLNAQRVSGYQEIGSLPPEAIEKVEVLPEQSALRFGFPPTRRVVNFITKRRFRQIEAKGSIGTTIPWGSATEKANLGLTRLHEGRRVTANLEFRRTDPLFQSERSILPDPGIPFDAIGNVTALDGGEIDPALSAAVGQAVTIAPVPDLVADRGTLAAYAAGANRQRLFDLGPYATLRPHHDTIKGEAVIADRIGETLAGSLSLSAEQGRDRSIGGLAPARLIVPASSPYSPFAGPVILNRYLGEVDPLRQHQTTTTLHAGASLRGAIAGWQWDFTASADQKRIRGRSERDIDLTAANAAIAAGADPFAPLDPALLTARQIDRTRLRTRTIEAKAVATNRPVRLPAGQMTVTATVEAGRSTAASSLRGPTPFDLRLGRSRIEGALAVDVPLTSRRDGVLALLGDLSMNASANLRRVGSFGALHDSTFGLSWAPLEGLQLLAGVRRTAAAPDMAQQSTPVREVPNVPVFDFGTGRTELVTVIHGGNPDLLAERRRVRSLTLNFKPLAKSQLRLGGTYEAISIRDQTGTVAANTPRTEAILPELVTRDETGRLISVAYHPINFHLERQETLQLTLNSSGQLGKEQPPDPGADKGKPPPRPSYYAGIGARIMLTDRLQLRPDAPELDLLAGDSIGTWTPRAVGWAYGGINHGGVGGTLNAWYGGARRIRSDDPAADLRFASLLKLNLGAYLPVQKLLKGADWASRLQLRLDIENITDSRQRVQDRNGAVPFRHQTDLIDPVGRTVTVTLRKLF